MQPHTPSAPTRPSYAAANGSPQQQPPAPPGWQLPPAYNHQPNSHVMHQIARLAPPIPTPHHQQQPPPATTTAKPSVQTTLNNFFSAGCEAPAEQPMHQPHQQEHAGSYNTNALYPASVTPALQPFQYAVGNGGSQVLGHRQRV